MLKTFIEHPLIDKHPKLKVFFFFNFLLIFLRFLDYFFDIK